MENNNFCTYKQISDYLSNYKDPETLDPIIAKISARKFQHIPHKEAYYQSVPNKKTSPPQYPKKNTQKNYSKKPNHQKQNNINFLLQQNQLLQQLNINNSDNNNQQQQCIINFQQFQQQQQQLLINLKTEKKLVRQHDPESEQKIKDLEQNSNKFLNEMKEKNKKEELKKFSNIRFSLNILSPDNLTKIKEDLLKNLKEMESQELKDQFIELLIKKAIEDQKYQNTYASLFQHIFENTDLKKQIILELQLLFNGEKELQPLKNKFQTLEEPEKKKFIENKRKKFLQLGKMLGNFYKNGILPLKIIQNILSRLLQNFVEGYDFFLFKQIQNQEVNLEKDYYYQDYIEMLIEILERSGKQLEQRHSKKLNSAKYQDEIRTERAFIKKIAENIVGAKENPLESDLDGFEFPCPTTLSGIFEFLEGLRKNNILDARLRVLVVNLTERRLNGWEEKMQVKDNTAQTRKQILQEFKIENKNIYDLEGGDNNNSSGEDLDDEDYYDDRDD